VNRATAVRLAAVSLPMVGATALTVLPASALDGPPVPAVALPKAMDVAVPYQGMTFCDPTARPGVVAFAQLFSTHYRMGSAGGITRACGNGITEHSDGRAWDWMLNVNKPQEKAVAESVLAWLTGRDSAGVAGGVARRFGIMYIIWNNRQWRAYDTARGWAPYHGDSPHTDHIHFSFTWNGAMKRTSWWTGSAATTILTGPAVGPAPQGGPIVALSYGMESDAVKALQRALGGLPVTGWFGPMTQTAVQNHQRRFGLPVTGVADRVTLATLGLSLSTKGTATAAPLPSPPAAGDLRFGMTSATVELLQKRLGGLPTTGYFGPMTRDRVLAFQKDHRLAQTGVADTATRRALNMVRQPSGPTAITASTCAPTAAAIAAARTMTQATRYTPYLQVRLTRGCRGEAVRVAQRALGGLAVDGDFGPLTEAAVRSYQKSVGLTVTGSVDKAMWRSLEKRAYPFLQFRSRAIKVGSTGEAVVAVQKALGVSQTGYFGPLTEAAVRAFQKANSLTQTGVVAAPTWEALDRRFGRY
jgi:peptidoglycan hydrolase-like protein with peptidoglycan-binding domain